MDRNKTSKIARRLEQRAIRSTRSLRLLLNTVEPGAIDLAAGRAFEERITAFYRRKTAEARKAVEDIEAIDTSTVSAEALISLLNRK